MSERPRRPAGGQLPGRLLWLLAAPAVAGILLLASCGAPADALQDGGNGSAQTPAATTQEAAATPEAAEEPQSATEQQSNAAGQPEAVQGQVVSETARTVAQTSGADDTDRTGSRAVRVVRAEVRRIATSRSTSVTVEPGREARVAAGTGGRVEQVLVREGGRVEADDPVIRLDEENLQLQVNNAQLALETATVNLESARRASDESTAQAEVSLRAAESNLELARNQYREGQELYELGAISSTELANLDSQLAQAQSNHQQAQDALARSRRALQEDLELQRLQVAQARNQLSQARAALEDAVVRAPFAGVVANVMAEQGEFLGAGSPAFRLVSTEHQRARFSVPPGDAQSLLAQGIVHIPYNGLSYAAQITNSSDIPGESRLVELTAQIYPSEKRIPNGTVAQLRYEVVLGEGVIVPSGALSSDAGQSSVMRVEERRAVQTPVEVLAESSGEAVVDGVPEGSLVIYPRPPDLLSGSPVEVLGEAASQ